MSTHIRVVVADDSADICRMLRLALEIEADFDVVGEAYDGQAAVDLVERERPDAIVLDLAMPVMDGLQAITHIRECSPLTRIVILSGFNASEMASEARSLGADAYLEKGTSFRDVAELLRGLYERDVESERPAAPGVAEEPRVPTAAVASDDGSGVAATGTPGSLPAALAGAPDLDTAFDLFAAGVKNLVDFDRASFSVVSDDGTACRVVATSGEAAWRLPVGSAMPLDREGLDRLGRGQPWAVADTAAHPGLVSVSELHERGLRSFVSVPIVVGGHLRVLVSFASVDRDGLGPAAAETLAALIEPVGAVLHVLALLDEERDVSRRMRDLDRLRSDFVGMVAHDLRAPMAVIAGFAEGLERGWEKLDDEQKRDFICRISRNIGNLTALVEDMLTVSHIESREFHLDIRSLDLAALLQQCVDEQADTAHDREIVLDVPGDLPAVHSDARRQRQVLGNLIGNALKFSEPADPVVVGARVVGDAIEVWVRDHGIGIADDDQSRLFERFYRTTEAQSRDSRGTGLGLFICRSLVESWGGQIRVDSTQGAGSVFTYTTPLTDAAVEADERSVLSSGR